MDILIKDLVGENPSYKMSQQEILKSMVKLGYVSENLARTFDDAVSDERISDIRLGAVIETIPSKREKSKTELMEWLENADKENK